MHFRSYFRDVGSQAMRPEDSAAAAAVCACFHFRRASRAVTQLFDTILAPSGLRSTQFVILVAVHAADGPVSLPDLANALGVDRSTLTRNLQPLRKAGLLRAVSNKRSRASHVRLTAKGTRVLNEAAPLWEEAQTRFVAKLGERRWPSLLGELDGVVSAARDA